MRLGLSLGLFAGALTAGWWVGRAGVLTSERANRLIRFVVKRLSPAVLCLLFWQLSLTRDTILLPMIGFAISCVALLPAWWYSQAARLNRPQTGSFLTCSVYSNLGYLGAFSAFALFGEAGYGLAMLYLVFFSPSFYTIGLTIAKRYGQTHEGPAAPSPLSDELRLYPFLGLVLGVALNLGRVPRPSMLGVVNHVLIPVDTALYLMAIGSQLTIEPVWEWLNPCVAMSVIKFLYTPLVGWALVSLCHLGGLPRFIVLLQASMPVAISPLILSMLFGLDRRLASSLWIFTTILAIPWLVVYLPLIR